MQNRKGVSITERFQSFVFPLPLCIIFPYISRDTNLTRLLHATCVYFLNFRADEGQKEYVLFSLSDSNHDMLLTRTELDDIFLLFDADSKYFQGVGVLTFFLHT